MSIRTKLIIEMIWYALIFLVGAYNFNGWLNGTQPWWWGVAGLLTIIVTSEKFSERWRLL